MAINTKIRDELVNDYILFDNPYFDNSIIGISNDDRVVYDFDKMVQELKSDEGITMEDAIEWVCYNTIRSIPYGGPGAPIVCERIMI
jgi:hypothetical protein